MQHLFVLTSILTCNHKQISQLKYFDTKTQICNQKLYFKKVIIQYCNKQASLAQLTQSAQIIYPSEGTTYVALYTEAVQNIIVNYSFSSASLPSFALFGLVKTNIQIQSSKLSVETPDLYQGALICFQCGLNASHAEFVFVSSGKELSGLIIRGLNYMDLSQVLVQLRLNGEILGGLCSQAGKIEMSLKETNISGYFTGTRCGALISFVTETVKIQVQNTRVCRNGVPNIFQGSDLAQISEPLFEDCTVCGDKYYAYGLCLLTLKNGVIQAPSLVCSSQFVFGGQDCVCPEGQIQNGSECFDILNSMNQIIDKDLSLQFQIGLKPSPDVLSVDSRILNNISAQSQYVNNDISAINSNIINIDTTLDERVLEDNYLQNRKTQLTAQIQDFVNKITCNRQYGYSWQNGQCALLSCSVEGQAAIKGVCQCPGIFQYVLNNKCVCPENSAVIAGICTCTVIGQIPQNQVCVCTTNNAFVKDGACTCGVFGLNISNTCSCPVNSNIVAGTCTCNVINQYITGNQCVCPNNSLVVTGTCTCSIIGQIMINQVCVCFTKDAFVKNDACTCAVYGLNISNVCSCPQNSKLVNGICTCVIYGQSMISGSCQCILSQTLQNGKCTYIVNSVDVNMVCDQKFYVQNFDILDVTNNIVNPFNGYLFGSNTYITNAFINIQSYVYAGTLYPLFQSQYQFTNIKIQIGTQTFGSGTFLETQKQISVNYLCITSITGTSIILNAYVYLLVPSVNEGTNNINNFMINISLSYSSGQFTLINQITTKLTITNYSIFGIYQNSQTTSFVSFGVTSSTVLLINITILPTTFNVGNQSSYIFNNVNGCAIKISDVNVRVGTVSSFQTANQIASNSDIYFQFGGFVSYIINSEFWVTQLIHDCYSIYVTGNIRYSGIIVGFSNSNANIIFIINVCFQQNIQSSSVYQFFGMIGQNNGNLTIQYSYVTFTLKASYLSSFGMIGAQSSDSQQSCIINLRTTFTVSVDARGDVGAVMGWQEGQNLQIDNCVVFNSSLYAKCYVGGVIGSLQNQLKMNNVSVIKTNLSANDNSSGGFIGWSYSCHFFINNSNVQSSRLYCNERIGIILGRNYKSTTFQVINSWSTNNYFYETLQYDCPNLNDAFSDQGC
ncbi:Conserved_hypothetical protein [Hexamita inflata]|uniref:Uncharacterized protein n=1 Tax=Hexamita inflata TaxID=28002 RepID=A0AA86TXE2_9EUKA|nr:Conserved hypothetical protein [Hexamita inflata]